MHRPELNPAGQPRGLPLRPAGSVDVGLPSRHSGDRRSPEGDGGRGMGSGLRRNDGGEAFSSSLRRPPESRGVGDEGWVPACAGTTEGEAFTWSLRRPPESRGGWGTGMGSGLRRNDGGEAFTSSLRRPPESRGGWGRGWVPACAGTTEARPSHRHSGDGRSPEGDGGRGMGSGLRRNDRGETAARCGATGCRRAALSRRAGRSACRR